MGLLRAFSQIFQILLVSMIVIPSSQSLGAPLGHPSLSMGLPDGVIIGAEKPIDRSFYSTFRFGYGIFDINDLQMEKHSLKIGLSYALQDYYIRLEQEIGLSQTSTRDDFHVATFYEDLDFTATTERTTLFLATGIKSYYWHLSDRCHLFSGVTGIIPLWSKESYNANIRSFPSYSQANVIDSPHYQSQKRKFRQVSRRLAGYEMIHLELLGMRYRF